MENELYKRLDERQDKIEELKAALVERDREIAALKAENEYLRECYHKAQTAMDTARAERKTALQAGKEAEHV